MQPFHGLVQQQCENMQVRKTTHKCHARTATVVRLHQYLALAHTYYAPHDLSTLAFPGRKRVLHTYYTSAVGDSLLCYWFANFSSVYIVFCFGNKNEHLSIYAYPFSYFKWGVGLLAMALYWIRKLIFLYIHYAGVMKLQKE